MNSDASKNWVDTHFHVFNAGEAVVGARYVPPYQAALDKWRSLSRDVGVMRGVCVQPSFLGCDNRLMLQALTLHPDTLRGVAVMAADAPSDALQGLHDQGVRGIRLNLMGLSHDIPEWCQAASLWQTMHGLGWHVEVHTDVGALPQVLAQLPTDLPVVIDHMGKPLEAKVTDASVSALLRRAKCGPTYVKLSGAYRLGSVDANCLAKLWLHELGPQALLWGSDWPCTNHEALAHYGDLLGALVDWVGPQYLDEVLCANPQRLYWDTHA